MVNHQNPQLDLAFGALSDRTRRAMLFRIAEGDATVSELAEPHDMSIAAVSKHLMVLERAGLITKERSGRDVTCRLNPAPFKDVVAILEELERFWTGKLDALETYFANRKKGSAPHDKPRSKENHSRPKKRGV